LTTSETESRNCGTTTPAPAAGESVESLDVHSRLRCVTFETSAWTPSGFLCLLADFAQASGLFECIQNLIHLPMKEVQYTQLEKIKTLLAMIMLGCKHISDINYCLRPYPIMAQTLGMEKFPEQSQINRLLHNFSGQLYQVDHLFETLLMTFGLCRDQAKVNFDFDCTGLVVYGEQFELCRKGYFSRRPGSKGYQLSLGYTFGYSPCEILSLHLDPGNFHPSGRFWDAIFQAAEILGSLDRIGVIRADGAQGSGANIQGLIEMDLGFIVKGYSPHTARVFAREMTHEQWEAIDLFTRVADLGLRKIHSCRYQVRTILVEALDARREKDYFNLFTHFTSESMMAPEVFRYYNGRQNIEALIKGEKHSLHIIPMKTRSFAANYAFLYFAVIVFNLLAWFKHRVLKGTNLEHLGLHDLTTKLMHIPAQIQFNDKQLELAFPSQHPMIRELSQPPRADQAGAGDRYF